MIQALQLMRFLIVSDDLPCSVAIVRRVSSERFSHPLLLEETRENTDDVAPRQAVVAFPENTDNLVRVLRADQSLPRFPQHRF